MARRSAGSAGMRRSLGAPAGEVAFGRDDERCRDALLGVLPSFDQPLGQVAAGLHEERARTHRHVADFEREDFAWAILSFHSAFGLPSAGPT